MLIFDDHMHRIHYNFDKIVQGLIKEKCHVLLARWQPSSMLKISYLEL